MLHFGIILNEIPEQQVLLVLKVIFHAIIYRAVSWWDLTNAMVKSDGVASLYVETFLVKSIVQKSLVFQSVSRLSH